MKKIQKWSPPRGRVLVLAPHPDDEALGCGGAILMHRRRKDPVKVVFVTDGEAGDPKGFYRRRDYRNLRRTEAKRAASVLGLTDTEFWAFPDQGLSRAKGLREKLKELLRTARPDIVYRPSAEDPHPDHRGLAKAFEAVIGTGKIDFVDCRYEVCELPKPSAVLDVSGAFATKLAALKRYRSQLRYQDYLKTAAMTGTCRSLFLPGARYAEAFRVSPVE